MRSRLAGSHRALSLDEEPKLRGVSHNHPSTKLQVLLPIGIPRTLMKLPQPTRISSANGHRCGATCPK